jgi:hypothetical protein
MNKYYDKDRGIGRHGDIERGPEHSPSRGMVNCLKVGFHIPMLFSWYKDAKPAGKNEDKWSTTTVAACFTLGHGDYYQMSAKS